MARGANVKGRWTPGRLKSREGQALAEYALVLTFVAIACVAALVFLGGNISAFYATFAASF